MIIELIVLILVIYTGISLIYFEAFTKQLDSPTRLGFTEEEQTAVRQLLLLVFLYIFFSWPSIAFGQLTGKYED